MIFSWLRRRRRRQILAQPFPEEWEQYLLENFAQYHWLTAEQRTRLKQRVQVFVAEKYWEGCNGLEMTDEIRVTVAGQACMLVLGFDEECFDRLLSVLVYPTEYFAPEKEHRGGGVVLEGYSLRLGEAWHSGPVILSWPDVLAGARLPHDGRNVVYHEFAHVLDMVDNSFDGTPRLGSAVQYRVWREVMTADFQKLVRQIERGQPTLLDQYGATNEAEFFAVCTESFFEQPRQLAAEHPRLYKLFCDYYRQDPATYVPAGSG